MILYLENCKLSFSNIFLQFTALNFMLKNYKTRVVLRAHMVSDQFTRSFKLPTAIIINTPWWAIRCYSHHSLTVNFVGHGFNRWKRYFESTFLPECVCKDFRVCLKCQSDLALSENVYVKSFLIITFMSFWNYL